MTVTPADLTASIAGLTSTSIPPFAGRAQINYSFLTVGANGTYKAADYATGFTQNADVLAIQNIAIQTGSQSMMAEWL